MAKTRTIKTKAGYGKKAGKIILPTTPQMEPKKLTWSKKAKETKAVTRFNSPIDEGDKARFLQYLPRVISLRLAVASDTSDLRNAYKAAKAHGFSKADFDYAIAVQTPEREASTKENIRRRLLVAKWMGSDLGSQLDLFSEPSRVPDQAAILKAKASKTADKYTKPKVPKPNGGGFMDSREALRIKGGGFGMDEEEFAAEQARAAPALTAHGLDEDEAP